MAMMLRLIQHVSAHAPHLRGRSMPQLPAAQMMSRDAHLIETTVDSSDADWKGAPSSAIMDFTCNRRSRLVSTSTMAH